MASWPQLLVFYAALVSLIGKVYPKISRIKLEDDNRPLIPLVSFGILEQGYLNVSVELVLDSMNFENFTETAFGLTLDRTLQSERQSQYLESSAERQSCGLTEWTDNKTVVLRIDAAQKRLQVTKNKDVIGVEVCSVYPLAITTDETAAGKTTTVIAANTTETRASPATTTAVTTTALSTTVAKPADRTVRGASEDSPSPAVAGGVPTLQSAQEAGPTSPCTDSIPTGVAKGCLPIQFVHGQKNLSFTFAVSVPGPNVEGLYSLYFHNCLKDVVGKTRSIKQLEVTIHARNPGSYLSAGDIPLPYVYFGVAGIAIVMSLIWLRVLCTASSGVYKTHYLMLAVCFVKVLSAFFHGMNFFYIGKKGMEETAWAVIYYIIFLFKTMMLFLTILLVGSGWSFIKHIFSDKEKKLFLVAIPLQLLSYIATVMMNETESATKAYSTWFTLSIVVDLLCCALILAPVIWSIKHLQDASMTSGKAALNLQKLQLFRSLYVMIIVYIYITRLALYILKIMLPFKLAWLSDLFMEVTVAIFLTMLGFKFRPADDNPYFQIPPDSDDDETIELVVTQSGVLADLKRRVVKVDAEDEESESQQGLLTSGKTNEESSHEYD